MFATHNAKDLIDDPSHFEAHLKQQIEEAQKLVRYTEIIDHCFNTEALNKVLLDAFELYLYDASISGFGKLFPCMCMYVRDHGQTEPAHTRELVANCFSVFCTGAMYSPDPKFIMLVNRQAKAIFDGLANGAFDDL